MLSKMLLVAVAFAPSRSTTCSNAEFDQCGGTGWAGETCCPDYDTCTFVNSYYSACQPKDLCLNPQYGQCAGYDDHQPPRPWTPANHHQECCPASFYCSYQSAYYSQCVYNTTANTTCAGGYDQCGGQGWTGKTCCIPGFKCVNQSDYYSGCAPEPICTNARFGQCGGVDADGNPWTEAFHHSDCCPEGFECSFKSSYFSQCVKTAPVTAKAMPDCSTTACPAKCTCAETKCADKITDCLADDTCSKGQTCADACPCGDNTCLIGCGIKFPSAKASSVLSCVTANCPA